MLNFLLDAATGVTWELPFEIPFIQWFQSLGGKGSFLYYVMNLLSMLGEEMVLVGVLGFVYWGLDKERGKKLGLFMASATLFNPMIKHIFRRSRPFVAHNDTVLNLRDVDGYSFPSGHSSGSASVFFGSAVAYQDKKRKWLWAIGSVIPLLVALSRTYVGAHYPTDVLAGLVLGVGLVFLLNFLWTKLNKYYLYGGLLVIGFAGFFYCTESDFFTGYGLVIGFITGLLFEEKITKFSNTKVWWRILLRIAIGGGLFLGLNEGSKILMSLIYKDYAQNIWFEHIFRVLRYGGVVFTMIGVYPMLFAPAEKLWRKWHWLQTDDTLTGKLKTPEVAPEVTATGAEGQPVAEEKQTQTPAANQ